MTWFHFACTILAVVVAHVIIQVATAMWKGIE